MRKPSTPKRQSKPETGPAGWYSYYAGYPSGFVRDVIVGSDLQPGSVVLDPWVGSGTTTAVAHDFGMNAVGYDINPVMVLVSKARMLGAEVSASEVPLCRQIVEMSNELELFDAADPLNRWFGEDSVKTLRSLELAIYSLLIGARDHKSIREDYSLHSVSSLAAFFYVALFRTERELLHQFQSSNPTWLRIGISEAERITPSRKHVAALFWKHVTVMAAGQFQLLPENDLALADGCSAAELARASATSLPEANGSVRLTIGSPPYCTRIDYVMSTYPELAILGYDDAAIGTLRREMIGTTTVEPQEQTSDPKWGRACVKLLSQIYEHPSYASRSYYHKNLAQYFRGLYRSLSEIDRVSARDGEAVLVVQDSNFKDVHIDLAKIVAEMFHGFGWEKRHQFNYPSTRHLGRIHGQVGQQITATESAIYFGKGA